MNVESIRLSEITQAVKEKCYMISPISGTYSTKQTYEQKGTGDTEKKNKLTVMVGGRGEGNNGRKKRKCQVKEHVQSTHEHGQWGGGCLWEQ